MQISPQALAWKKSHLQRDKDVQRDCKFSACDSAAKAAKTANYSSSLCEVGSYPPGAGLRANLLQGSRRTHQPQPGSNKKFNGGKGLSASLMCIQSSLTN